MKVKGYKLTTEWTASNGGSFARATQGGGKYHLKRYGKYALSEGEAPFTEEAYKTLEERFDVFMGYRAAMVEELWELAGSGGNIVIPVHTFVDEPFYIEVTEYIDRLTDYTKCLRLSLEDKLFLMMTAAGALCNIHRHKVVHGNLTHTNLLAAKNRAGKVVAKLTDFGRSFFAGNVQLFTLGYDLNFASPEMVRCMELKILADTVLTAEMAKARAALSTRSDIFSLGLIFHDYLTGGEHPSITGLSGEQRLRAERGEAVYCGETLLRGGKLIVSEKVEEPYLSRLLAAMLQLRPEARPTAEEVLEVLQSKRILERKENSPVLIAGEN